MTTMPRETIAPAAARGRHRAAGMRAGREAAERIAKAVVEEVNAIAREYGERAVCEAANKMVAAVLAELERAGAVLEVRP